MIRLINIRQHRPVIAACRNHPCTIDRARRGDQSKLTVLDLKDGMGNYIRLDWSENAILAIYLASAPSDTALKTRRFLWKHSEGHHFLFIEDGNLR